MLVTEHFQDMMVLRDISYTQVLYTLHYGEVLKSRNHEGQELIIYMGHTVVREGNRLITTYLQGEDWWKSL